MINSNNIAEATTSGIKVQVTSKFIPEHSDPNLPRYFFAYWVTIKNESQNQIKILNRHWEIKDSLGEIQIINGKGVIGEQPTIEPGASFSYNSFCPLKTEFGLMKGHYGIAHENNNQLNIQIPEFKLISPFSIN